MDQPRNPLQQADRYGGIPLGVESAWPTSYGAPTAVPGLSTTPSSSPERDFGVGVAASLLVAVLLAGTTLVAQAAPYAPTEYDFSGLSAMEPAAFGVVETVREFALHEEELVVRLDDGRSVKVLLESNEHFRPGERVRLVAGRPIRT